MPSPTGASPSWKSKPRSATGKTSPDLPRFAFGTPSCPAKASVTREPILFRSSAAIRKCPNGVYNGQVQTVAETPIFSRQADKLFNEEERR